MQNQPPDPPIDSQLVRALLGGEFGITAELTPPVSGTPERLLERAIADGAFLDATREVLREYGGLWFQDESFVVSRRRG